MRALFGEAVYRGECAIRIGAENVVFLQMDNIWPFDGLQAQLAHNLGADYLGKRFDSSYRLTGGNHVIDQCYSSPFEF